MAQGRVNPTIITIIIIVLLGAGAGGIYAYNQANNTEPSATQSESSDTNAPVSDTSSETTISVYTDGTYTAQGDYSTPGGSEEISVTVTLAGGSVTDVEADGSATGGNSAQYQREFLSGYKSEVVGKSLDEVQLSRVAGSSLTSTGFNRALDTIKNDARG